MLFNLYFSIKKLYHSNYKQLKKGKHLLEWKLHLKHDQCGLQVVIRYAELNQKRLKKKATDT